MKKNESLFHGIPLTKKGKKRTCTCSRTCSRRSSEASSNPTVPYIARGEIFDKIFRKGKDEVITVPEPSYVERVKFYMECFVTPERPTYPPIEASMVFSDLVLPENDKTTDQSKDALILSAGQDELLKDCANDAFDWSALQDELLKIAEEMGIPPSGSEQFDILMHHLEKNTVFMTLSESLKGKKERIREDSSLGPILEQIQSGGPDVMKRYWNDKDLLLKLGLGEIDLGNDDKSFNRNLATSIEVSEGKSHPAGDPKTYDWDSLRARLFVMLLA